MGWKIYFCIVVGVSLLGLSRSLHEPLNIFTLLLQIIALFGLFGHAWRRRVAGSPRFWRGLGWFYLAWYPVSLTIGYARARADFPPPWSAGQTLSLIVAYLLIGILWVPVAVALLQYARRLEHDSNFGGRQR